MWQVVPELCITFPYLQAFLVTFLWFNLAANCFLPLPVVDHTYNMLTEHHSPIPRPGAPLAYSFYANINSALLWPPLQTQGWNNIDTVLVCWCREATYKSTLMRISSLSRTCSHVFPTCCFHWTWHFLQLSCSKTQERKEIPASESLESIKRLTNYLLH